MIVCRQLLGEHVEDVAVALDQELVQRPPASPRKHFEAEQALALAWAGAGGWDELDRAAGRARMAAEAWRVEASDPALVDVFVAAFSLSIYDAIAGRDRHRASEYVGFAVAAISRVPSPDRPVELMSAIEAASTSELSSLAD
jgi:hypothetical protein